MYSTHLCMYACVCMYLCMSRYVSMYVCVPVRTEYKLKYSTSTRIHECTCRHRPHTPIHVCPKIDMNIQASPLHRWLDVRPASFRLALTALQSITSAVRTRATELEKSDSPSYELRGCTDANALRSLVRYISTYLQVESSGIQSLKEGRNALPCFYEESFQVKKNRLFLVLIDEGRRHSRSPTTSCPPNTMDVVFNLLRHIVVDHMLDGRKIQAFRCHVRTHQHVFPPFPVPGT